MTIPSNDSRRTWLAAVAIRLHFINQMASQRRGSDDFWRSPEPQLRAILSDGAGACLPCSEPMRLGKDGIEGGGILPDRPRLPCRD